MAINEKDLLRRIETLEKQFASLEKGIERLEKALGGGAKPKSDQDTDDYEQIIKMKETSVAYYFLTNKGRVLQSSSLITPVDWVNEKEFNNGLIKFKGNLLAVGEQDLFKGDTFEAVMECVAALRAKYRATAGLPCLLPNMSAVMEDGTTKAYKESTKAIKFK